MFKIMTFLVCLMVIALAAHANEIGFIESFSLAEDRSVPLKQLIPGTEDSYFYTCLRAEQRGEWDVFQATLDQWIKRYGHTAKVEELRNRQLLLKYERDPQATVRELAQRLNLHFNHQKQQLKPQTTFPTRLDQNLISRETLTRRAFSEYGNLEGFEDSALDFILNQQLSPDRYRNLLQRLTRPDVPNLAKIVVADLNYENSGGFGSISIHRNMLLSQLEECARMMPELMTNTPFIETWMTRLQPGPEIDWQNDPAARQAYLDRMWTFVKPLAPSFNSLKAHVLYQRLVHDRSQGIFDKTRFFEYLKLPRAIGYMRSEYLQRKENRDYPAQLGADFRNQTLMPPINTDEPLVRDYLAHFLVQAPDSREFAEYIEAEWLKQVFAETKILYGVGDQEKWYSLMDPEVYQRLKERVDLELLPTNRETLSIADPVTIDLAVKNVSTLFIKVYEINTLAFYREKSEEITTAIDLDGLVANEEKVATYSDVALRRHIEKFTFPQLNRAGVWVVEFLGNGQSSRALIRKGRLAFVERLGAAGHVFTLFDENGTPLPEARLWLAGHEYTADRRGEVSVPFSNSPSQQKIIVSTGSFAALHTFQHQGESYALTAGISVDRESLLEGKTSKVLVRPDLSLNGTPIDLKLFEEPVLVVETTDREGIASTREYAGLKLQADSEYTCEFKVPEKLSRIAFTLRGKVQGLLTGRKIDLTTGVAHELNGIEKTDKIEALYLRKTGAGFVVELLGKTGEPRDERAVQFEFKHRFFRRTTQVTLKTDANGRIELGELRDIETIIARGPENSAETWRLGTDRHGYPAVIHAQAGTQVQIPIMETNADNLLDICSLLELRGGAYFSDQRGNVGIGDGFLTLPRLPAGDYDLWLKQPRVSIRIRLTDGKPVGSHLVHARRILAAREIKPLQISKVEADRSKEWISIQLKNASNLSRVHVVATRFLSSTPLFDALGLPSWPTPTEIRLSPPLCRYLSGRSIGDEYKYILERKYAPIIPGNLLQRPGLLLNPWSIRKTDTGRDEAKAGENWQGVPEASAMAPCPAPCAPCTEVGGGAGGGAGGSFPRFDFLPDGSLVLSNLRPDANGVVTVAMKAIGSRQHLQIVAIDPFTSAGREVALPELQEEYRDLRLATGLDSQKHFTEQKAVGSLTTDQTFTLADITTSKLEVYDSLGTVYRLFTSLNKDATLVEFGFLLGWPELAPERKRELYSKYACHELSFFLYKKDPEFFKTVIKPYLANKKDQTFLDKWLLEKDLTEYLKPWAFQRLNMFERILLGMRLPEQTGAVSRHLSDRYDLLPPDIDAFNTLFATALKGSSLETDDRFGFEEAQKKVMPAKPMMQRPAMKSMAPPPPPPPGAARASGMMAGGMKSKMAREESMRKDKGMAVGIVPLSDEMSENEGFAAAEPAPMEVDDADGIAMDDMKADLGRRQVARQFYRKLEKTEEYVENNYYHLPIERQIAELITINGFWRDYAGYVAAGSKGPFLSTRTAEASRSFPEMILALAVLDLPFKPGQHVNSAQGQKFELKAASPALIFHKQIREAALAGKEKAILIGQNFFAADDRYRYENNERLDKFVTEEFQTQRVYGCQIVLTNPTSTPRKVDLLMQIPNGAIPVNNGFVTRGTHLPLDPFSTRTIDYLFYFPLPGTFKQFPVHVAQDEKLLGWAEPFTFTVVDTLTKFDKTSWPYISQHGSNEEVLEFLRKNNIDRLDLNLIAFRMRDLPFFKQAIDLLQSRLIYQDTLWSYGILHNLPPVIREYLQHSPFATQCGPILDSPLLTVNPVARFTYQHREYLPLVNARVNQLGKQRKILNTQCYQQYIQLLNQLAYKPALDDVDRLAVTYYLLLQDRVDEGGKVFDQVKDPGLLASIQYAYLQSWLAFCREKPQTAQQIAATYKDYPVDRWRNLFRDVLAQCDEITGKAASVTDTLDRNQVQTQLADTEGTFEFVVEDRKILLQHQNLTTCRINYYLMDLELLFSRNPFVQDSGNQFSVIRPNESVELPLASGTATTTVPLPDRFRDHNVMIEITSAGVTKSKASYPHSLGVQVMEKYGQVKVTRANDGTPLAKVYVKVYAKMKTGQTAFYKDGYTDLRGRFDYTSLSTDELDQVERFSMLILSESNGAVVREAAPPKQ